MRDINFAIIGCGKIAERHIEAIQLANNARIIAVCDQNQKLANEKSVLANAVCYTNYHDMLEKEPTIDLVTILTPSGMHFEQAFDVINHYHKSVLIEKPMVMTLRQANQLKAAANSHNVKIFPIYQHRFNKAVQRVKHAIDNSNELGKLQVGAVRVRWCRQQRYYDMSPWRGTWAHDGGALTNQGIHFIDLLRYICGEVKRVHARLGTFGVDIETEDTAIAIVEFVSGAIGTIEIMTSARPIDFEASISCVCKNGLANISGSATNVLETFTPDQSQTQLHSEHFSNNYGLGHNVIIQSAVNALLNNTSPCIDFDDGVRTIALLHALYKSDEIDGWVTVDGAGESNRLGVVAPSNVQMSAL